MNEGGLSRISEVQCDRCARHGRLLPYLLDFDYVSCARSYGPKNRPPKPAHGGVTWEAAWAAEMPTEDAIESCASKTTTVYRIQCNTPSGASSPT